MSDQVADQEIIDLALGSDPDAFGEIVRRYQNPVGNYVYRMVGNYDTAADLLQEIFLRAYRALARHDRSRSFLAWLLRIAHNHTVNHLRKRRVEATPMGEGEPTGALQSDVGPGDPSRAILAKERAGLLREALQSLPERYRAALILRYWTNLPYEEIARTVGKPTKAVKSDLDYGRKLLRKRLEGKM